jgi:hypothetical protein
MIDRAAIDLAMASEDPDPPKAASLGDALRLLVGGLREQAQASHAEIMERPV